MGNRAGQRRGDGNDIAIAMLRDYTIDITLNDRIVPHQTQLILEELSWAALGGCEAAQIVAQGSADALWLWATRLMADVEVYAPDTELIWSGILWGVTLEMPWGTFDYSLDELCNRVSVQYSYETGGGVGSRNETDWAEDAASIARYGIIERVLSASGTTPVAAEARRDRHLGQYAWPRAAQSPDSRRDVAEARLLCLGHWARLQQRVYTSAATGQEDSAAFALRVAQESAPWLSRDETQVEASGITTSQYRDDSRTAQYEVADAARIGSAAGSRVLTGIDARRRLYFIPIISEPGYYWKDGLPHNTMLQRLRPWQVQPGRWAEQIDIVIPSLPDVVEPGTFFIERVTMNEGGVQVEPTDAQTLERMLMIGIEL